MGNGMDEALESPRRLMGRPHGDETFPSGPVSGTLEAAMVLDAVSAEVHEGFERVVFTFHRLGSSPGVWADLPAVYAVSADAPPFTFRASGEPLAVEGRAFLRVNFLEMYGHASSDQPTPSGAFPGRSPAELRPGLEVVAQVCRSDDFEGYLEWIIGLTRGARWRVTRLDAPVRLLVDVENRVQLAPLGSA
jgi:hypothetical protein